MSGLKHVLFVCTGNTCRSPMAEAFFTKAIAGRDDYRCASAGLSASRHGSCNSETARVLKKRGLSLDGFCSQPVTPALLEEATHVFGMTRDHLDILELRFPEFSEKYYLVCEFVNIPGQGIGVDIPDPIGMGPGAYEEVADMLDRAIPAMVEYLERTA